MKRRHLIAAPLLLLAAPLGARRGRAQDITKPQPELPKQKLTIVTRDGKRHVFNVEMALTSDQQTVGLMWRTTVAPDGGMLFDWGQERRSEMWMRNTLAPLDMVFIGQDGTIRAIAEDTVPRSLAIIDSRVPVRATLELAAGTARREGLRVGDHVESTIFGGAG